jgi:phage terminase large subunit
MKLRKRIKGIAGGASAGKTISIIQILMDKAQSDTVPTLTSITSESMPHLKRGAMRDFLNIMEQHGYFQPNRWNKSDFTYTFETGSKIEFFSLDMPHKVRGPRRQRLFINEVNNIPQETFDQLEIRTEFEIWMDWNPTSEFFFYTDILNKRDDVDFEILTYKDNEGLQPSVIESIERRKNNKNWWLVYGMGQLGEVESRIYKDWAIIDEIPHEARLERYGLDFGFTNDPTSLVAIYKYNDGWIIDELIYSTGLTNPKIAAFILNLPKALVVADSAEPKSIAEIAAHGILISGARKGQDSVLFGIQFLQDQKISVTKNSVNTIKEYRNYLWMTDNSDKIINEPIGINDHSMSAIRYGLTSIYPDYRLRTAAPKFATGKFILDNLERQEDDSYYS